MKNSTIIHIDNDKDDQYIFRESLKDAGIENELLTFDNGPTFLDYLRNTSDQPFIIFCDINMPGDKGLDIKKQIDSDPYLRRKSIPFVFYSTGRNQEEVDEAYLELTVQGFFVKGDDSKTIARNLKLILDYWTLCIHPNTED